MAKIPVTRLDELPSLSYGHIFGEPNPNDLPHLQGTGRSGLSPTFFSGPLEPYFPADAMIPPYEAEREYQKRKLAGYTSSMLHAIGALEKPNIVAPTLANEIHPMIDISKWAPEGVTGLDYGLKGMYYVHNPAVWNALLPSLRLASRFLENVHCWPWWDALVYGEKRWLPIPPSTKEYPLRSFHRRPPNIVLEEGLKADEDFCNRFGHRVRIMIAAVDDVFDQHMANRTSHRNAMGFTQYLPQFDISRITLAPQIVGPLLRRDLTDSQRLVQQFQVTKTLLHEFAHAIGFLIGSDQGVNALGEPFFEGENIRELGESMETAMCGGRVWSYPSTLPERAFMVTTVQNWPNYALFAEKHDFGQGDQNLPGSAALYGPGSEQTIMAISISWIEALFQENFWSIYVRQFGSDALRPYPRLIISGTVIEALDAATGQVRHRVFSRLGADYEAYLAAKYGPPELPEVLMVNGVEASLPYRMDARKMAEAYEQCEILEQAMAWYAARTGVYGEA